MNKLFKMSTACGEMNASSSILDGENLEKERERKKTPPPVLAMCYALYRNKACS